MARKGGKKLNTNLIAFVTVTGIMLTVAVVFLAAKQSAKKDPEKFARAAREREKIKDYEHAIQNYWTAYNAGETKDPKYLLDCARLLFQIGDWGAWQEKLRLANSQAPEDASILRAGLDSAWVLADAGVNVADMLEDFGQKLQVIDKTSGYPLVSQARGMRLRNATLEKADALIDDAYKIEPLQPRVALFKFDLEFNRLATTYREKAKESDEKMVKAFTAEVSKMVDQYLRPSFDANPGHAALATYFSDRLLNVDRADEAEAVLQKALETSPDSPELHTEYARFVIGKVVRDKEQKKLSAEQRAALLAESKKHAEESIRLEPASYLAYEVLSGINLPPIIDEPTSQDIEKSILVFEEGRKNTLTYQSARSLMNERLRLEMIAHGFARALLYAERPDVKDDEPARQKRLAMAEEFLKDAETKYKSSGVAHFMRGDYSLVTKDTRRAQKAYSDAREAVTANTPAAQAAAINYWDRLFNRQPSEQLAVLYASERQFGEADRFLDEAIAAYATLRQSAPQRLLMTKVQTLLNLPSSTENEKRARTQQAESLIDKLSKPPYSLPESTLAPLRASASAISGDTQQAAKIVETLEDGPPKHMYRARLFAASKEFDKALAELREVLNDEKATGDQLNDAIVLFSQVCIAMKTPEVAQSEVTRLSARPTPAGKDDFSWKIALKLVEVSLSEPDEAKRREKQIELLKTDTDARRRASSLAQLFLRSDKMEDIKLGIGFLDELEKLDPDKIDLKIDQFNTAIRAVRISDRAASARGASDDDKSGAAANKKEFIERAQRYLAFLTDEKKNVDGAAGASFKGELALVMGNNDEAIKQFLVAVEKAPRSSDLFLKLARAYAADKNFENAAKYAEQAVQINPRDFQAQRVLFITHERLSANAESTAQEEAHYRRAKEAHSVALQLDPTDPDVVSYKQVIEDRDNPIAAVAKRETARKANPDDGDNLIELAKLYASLFKKAVDKRIASDIEDYKAKADRAFNEAADKRPNNLELVESALAYYSTARDKGKGEAIFQKFIDKLSPYDQIVAIRMLADFYERLFDLASAERLYLGVLSSTGPDSPLAKAVADPKDRQLAEAQLHYELMMLYRRHQKYQVMLDECQKIRRITGDKATEGERPKLADFRQFTRRYEVDAYIRLGKFEEAEQAIIAYRDAYPTDPIVTRLYVDFYLRRNSAPLNDRKRAIELLDAYIAQKPDDPGSRYNRGMLHANSARWSDAKKDLTQALEVAEASATKDMDLVLQILPRLAVACENLKLYEDAVKYLTTYLQHLEEMDARGQIQQAVERIVRLQRALRKPEEGLKLLSVMKSRRATEAYWPQRIGKWYEESAESKDAIAEKRTDFATAANSYANAVQLLGGPQKPAAAPMLALQIAALTKSGNAAEAARLVQSAGSGSMEWNVRIAGASAMLAGGQKEQAVKWFEQALLDIAQTPADQFASVLQAGDHIAIVLPPDEAIALFRSAIAKTPADSDHALRLLAMLGQQLVRAGKYPDAGTVLTGVHEKSAVYDPAQNPEMYGVWSQSMVDYAMMQQAMKDFAGAEKTYQAVIAKDPKLVAALNNLAWILAVEMDRPKDALPYAERAREIVGNFIDRASILDTTGYVYYRNDQLDLAEGVLGEAISADPQTWSAYEHLSDVHLKQGRKDDARAVLRSGLEQTKNNRAPAARAAEAKFRAALEKIQ